MDEPREAAGTVQGARDLFPGRRQSPQRAGRTLLPTKHGRPRAGRNGSPPASLRMKADIATAAGDRPGDSVIEHEPGRSQAFAGGFS